MKTINAVAHPTFIQAINVEPEISLTGPQRITIIHPVNTPNVTRRTDSHCIDICLPEHLCVCAVCPCICGIPISDDNETDSYLCNTRLGIIIICIILLLTSAAVYISTSPSTK